MSPQSHDHTAVTAPEVLDPVCGMTISPDDAVGHIDHKGHTYYFCGESCLEQFRTDPARFVDPQRTARPRSRILEAEYTCPMHPEMRQKGPGSCPICGMALEPRGVTLEEQPNPELDDMTRRFRAVARPDRADSRVHGCGVPAGPAAASSAAARRAATGSSSRWRPRSCCGAAGRSSSADGRRW